MPAVVPGPIGSMKSTKAPQAPVGNQSSEKMSTGRDYARLFEPSANRAGYTVSRERPLDRMPDSLPDPAVPATTAIEFPPEAIPGSTPAVPAPDLRPPLLPRERARLKLEAGVPL